MPLTSTEVPIEWQTAFTPTGDRLFRYGFRVEYFDVGFSLFYEAD